MTHRWWGLPGPSRFVEGIVGDLRIGRSAIICLPLHAPPGLSIAVQRELGEEWMWDRLAIAATERLPPVAQLYARLTSQDDEPGAIRNAGTLAATLACAEHGVWLDGPETFDRTAAEVWSDWSSFLVEYAHACQTLDPLYRSPFCVVLRGEASLSPPPADADLAVHRWRGQIDELDMLLYAADLLHDRRFSPLHRRLAAAVVSQVAAWDQEVAERLAGEDLRWILEPAPLLMEMAKERGWNSSPPCQLAEALDAAWQVGMVDIFEGHPVLHAAILSSSEQGQATDELERRLWSAQVAVLFPFVEEQRRLIVERFAGAFKLPHYHADAHREPIREARDLEIGHIYHQVRYQQVDLGEHGNRLIGSLKAIRDRLAHLQPLDPEAQLAIGATREIEQW